MIEDRQRASSRSSIFHPRSSNPSAFTLVELLVVILIIGILIAIIIPVAARIRSSGYKTTSLAQINALRSAIEAYHGTYNAYPGPFADMTMYQVTPGDPPLIGIGPTGPGSRMTQSENLTLGLLGGLRYDASTGGAAYSASDVGNGPRSLNPNAPGQHQAFYTDTKTLSKGFFSDRMDNAGSPVPVVHDSSVPEFQDTFPDVMPIIYLRARKGARGVMSDEQFYSATTAGALFQYDVRQFQSYLADCTSNPPTQGEVIGGKNQGGPNGNRGIWKLGSSDSDARNLTDPWDPRLPNYGAAYFKHPSLNPPGTTNDAGTPRNQGTFILISAGADRVFGTNDDLTSFGTPGPE